MNILCLPPPPLFLLWYVRCGIVFLAPAVRQSRPSPSMPVPFPPSCRVVYYPPPAYQPACSLVVYAGVMSLALHLTSARLLPYLHSWVKGGVGRSRLSCTWRLDLRCFLNLLLSHRRPRAFSRVPSPEKNLVRLST
ncbi:hypothetical protein BO82DRAFT_64736 [Aspergillus uvarum CBS 121591]|uniref:Secreted protein n=1 Tax=Aspergillus uvarum CBS 121591 TaxID=1448315 RepID=A0A319CTV7_9EURO|nr:hypothetical protein BO82DRAFT_64736 [Aspergillus uvarum CBS 121591]PYH82253.1 hypothetical protein BO82DRAFT_64736 [Aspergillus uvarum CBS 121591]